MVVHHSATSVTMEVDPPRNANSPDDPKTANGSSENEKAEDSESSEDGPPLDVGEHYLVRRYDDTWRKYTPRAHILTLHRNQNCTRKVARLSIRFFSLGRGARARSLTRSFVHSFARSLARSSVRRRPGRCDTT